MPSAPPVDVKGCIYNRPVPPNQVRAWAMLQSDIVNCDRCPRLRAHCQTVAEEKRAAFRAWDYWGKPLPNLGDPSARLLIVGLAPAATAATAPDGCSPATARAISC